MEAVLAIFADIDDPRDHTAQYELPALLLWRWQRRCAARGVALTSPTSLRRTEPTLPTLSICPPAPPPATTRSAGCSGCSIPNNCKQRYVASPPPCARVSACGRPRAQLQWMASACAAATNAAAPTCLR